MDRQPTNLEHLLQECSQALGLPRGRATYAGALSSRGELQTQKETQELRYLLENLYLEVKNYGYLGKSSELEGSQGTGRTHGPEESARKVDVAVGTAPEKPQKRDAHTSPSCSGSHQRWGSIQNLREELTLAKEQLSQTEVENIRLLEKAARQAEELEASQEECQRVVLEKLKLEEELAAARAANAEEREALRNDADELRLQKERFEQEAARLREELDTVKGGSTGRSLRQSAECRQTRKTPGLPTGARGPSLSEGGPPSANNSFCSDQRSEAKSEREKAARIESQAPRELHALLERAENYKRISEQLTKQIEEHKVLEYR